MRHAKKGRKLGSSASHRGAILRTMAAQLFIHGRLQTTEAKAKELRRVADKVITLAKRGDIHSRRQALALINNRELVHKIFSETAPKFQDRNGGYTRIIKLGLRMGDAAPVVIVELVS